MYFVHFNSFFLNSFNSEDASGDHGDSASLGAINPAYSNSSIPQSSGGLSEEQFTTYLDENHAVLEEKVSDRSLEENIIIWGKPMNSESAGQLKINSLRVSSGGQSLKTEFL